MATLYDGVIGMTVEEAEKFLLPHGINVVRVISKDYNYFVGTADYRFDRINVHVRADKIYSWSIG